MSIQLGSIGQIAKVTAVSEDGCRVYFDLRNGLSGWLNQEGGEYDIVEYDVGDVLLLVTEDGHQRAEKLPAVLGPTNCGSAS